MTLCRWSGNNEFVLIVMTIKCDVSGIIVMMKFGTVVMTIVKIAVTTAMMTDVWNCVTTVVIRYSASVTTKVTTMMILQ